MYATSYINVFFGLGLDKVNVDMASESVTNKLGIFRSASITHFFGSSN